MTTPVYNTDFLLPEATEEDIENINSIPQLREVIVEEDDSYACASCFFSTVSFPICHVIACTRGEREDGNAIIFELAD